VGVRPLAISSTQLDPAMIKGIKFASIPVRDQDKALAFYTKKLGFTVATDQPFNDKQRWIELKIPGADTKLVLFTPDGHEDRIGQFQAISFVADNVKKTYEELSGRGVEFMGPPQEADWGSSAIFKDPDGNQFVLSSK
jgi:catechol 2,3-dioxygenase-like lactoylglutathione lyase family enzyme